MSNWRCVKCNGLVIGPFFKCECRPDDWFMAAALDITEIERRDGYIGTFQIMDILRRRSNESGVPITKETA